MEGGLKIKGYKPLITMIFLQFVYAGLNLFSKVAFAKGMNPRVFVVYRHAIGTFIMIFLPLLFKRKNTCTTASLGIKGFAWIFLASLIGVTMYQNAYFEGIHLASATAASAIPNIIPAVTFLLTLVLRLEKVNMRRLRSVAKIIGTGICVGGAMCMALLKGPKLLSVELFPAKSFLTNSSQGHHWLLGCLLLIGGCFCWASWMIIQVPMTARCPDLYHSSAWVCFLGTIQSAVVTLSVERDFTVWKLNSYLEICFCLFGGITIALTFTLQAWSIAQRGPLYCAMFNPLCTVIVVIIAAIFLQESIYLGSLIGALGAVIGLYIVLWAKAKDLEEINKDMHLKEQNNESEIEIAIESDSSNKKNPTTDSEKPVLTLKSDDMNQQNDAIP